MKRARWTASLRLRLLLATLVALAVALLLAGLMLAGLFRDHVMHQFRTTLTAQLDQVTARLEFDATGQPQLDAATLSDPRWSRPYSGLYWQLDEVRGGAVRHGVLRSRSLWDAVLAVPDDALADGAVHQHEASGPDGASLLLLERTVQHSGPGDRQWRLLAAADLHETREAVQRFSGALAASLAALGVLLVAAAVAQVGVGLAPLRALRRALADVHAARSQRLEGRFPAEVQPLIDEFNGVLARNAEVVARARTQAGNLAHAIKTPLSALAQAAEAAQQHPEAAAELAALVQEQVAVARRHVDWHLARSRAAAAPALPGQRTALAPVVAGLLRVLARVYAERALVLQAAEIDPRWAFAGEEQDLQEMLGNVLDNACKWARARVAVSVRTWADPRGRWLAVTVDDDGPGIAAARRDEVMLRGARLDESVPGTGLGLAIVRELAGLYGGAVVLADAPAGGARVVVTLPAAASG